MKAGVSLFQKLIVGLLIMLSLIVLVFWLIYRLNVQVIQDELKKNKIAEVEFMTSQLSNQFEQILMNTIVLSEDQSVRAYPNMLNYGDEYSRYETKLNIIDKLALNSASTPWNNTFILYFPEQSETVSSDPSFSFSEFRLPDQPLHVWTVKSDRKTGEYFYSYLVKSHKSPLYIEVQIQLSQIRKVMSQYTSGTPLLYDYRNHMLIQNDSAPLMKETAQVIVPLLQGDNGFLSVDNNGTPYLLNYMKLNMMDFYFMDYHPMRQLIEPISRNNNYFMIAIVVLLLLSLISIFLLHRQVQLPIHKLRKAIEKFDQGDFSSRLTDVHAYDFRLLGRSFNRMAENTQVLIEQVLHGELQVKEARLMQYQAQINPHFLYNCLNFIHSKASVNDTGAVRSMTLHLGAYCRYIHKIEQLDATLEEELTSVEHYLSIMQLRKTTISFHIDVPKQLRACRLPRMILQPLVENCIIHGLELSEHSGLITIEALDVGSEFILSVRDNGAGMERDRLQAVVHYMDERLCSERSIGIGLRNVNQRIKLYYGKEQGLLIESKPGQGTTISIRMRKEGHHVSSPAG
ncbi:sensor histidine kinase [Paenibacillus sp. SYP-B4298]|uniref:sensor histidine kinase n=1 Tax=Paenibacillus sp. SYP-B4298 TaxID=2996034 RepID=UPI0022DE5FC0|nr:sensor histidine kinase [Paenibacillus sp. SYP-B4298]